MRRRTRGRDGELRQSDLRRQSRFLAVRGERPPLRFRSRRLADRAAVDRVLAEHSPAAIVHFAAESHVDRSIDGPAAFVRTNVQGTFELLDAARRRLAQLPADRREAFRFLHVSTDEVYGSLGPAGRFTETSPYDPSSPYSASKAAADHLARAYFRTFGLPVLMTNCSNNYGPYQFPEKLIPLMILNALEGKPLPVYGDGKHVRDWLYVEDHCRAISRVLTAGRPGETYNIGGTASRRTSMSCKPSAACSTTCAPGCPTRPHVADHVRQRPARPRPPLRHRRRQDPPRIRLAPEYDFAAGLRKTVEWYLDNSQLVARVASGEYQRQRLRLLDK